MPQTPKPPAKPTTQKPNDCKLLVIHGPNLNLLGNREPEIYGTNSLDDINHMLEHIAERHHITLDCFQSNHEGAIVDKIHASMDSTDGIIINPAAYTHTSIAIRDALVVYPSPIVEVHLSNIMNRESFRSESVIASAVTGTIAGFGVDSYRLGLLWLVKHLDK